MGLPRTSGAHFDLGDQEVRAEADVHLESPPLSHHSGQMRHAGEGHLGRALCAASALTNLLGTFENLAGDVEGPWSPTAEQRPAAQRSREHP